MKPCDQTLVLFINSKRTCWKFLQVLGDESYFDMRVERREYLYKRTEEGLGRDVHVLDGGGAGHVRGDRRSGADTQPHAPSVGPQRHVVYVRIWGETDQTSHF